MLGTQFVWILHRIIIEEWNLHQQIKWVSTPPPPHIINGSLPKCFVSEHYAIHSECDIYQMDVQLAVIQGGSTA